MWPSDGKPCEEDLFAQFSGSPPEGKVRAPDEDGYPKWSDAPLPTVEDLKIDAENMKAELIAYANTIIMPLQDAVDLDMATEMESKQLYEWKKYRVLLNRVNVSNAPDISWPTKP